MKLRRRPIKSVPLLGPPWCRFQCECGCYT